MSRAPKPAGPEPFQTGWRVIHTVDLYGWQYSRTRCVVMGTRIVDGRWWVELLPLASCYGGAGETRFEDNSHTKGVGQVTFWVCVTFADLTRVDADWRPVPA